MIKPGQKVLIRLPLSYQEKYPKFYQNFNNFVAEVCEPHRFQPDGQLMVQCKGWNPIYVQKDFCHAQNRLE